MVRHSRELAHAFGFTDEGVVDLPRKCSNVRIARIMHTRDRGGCSICFPHSLETSNSTRAKNRRSWKLHRSQQYRDRSVENL